MKTTRESDEKVANITPFGLRLQPALKSAVERAAKASGRSLNSEIAARLERTFRDDEDALANARAIEAFRKVESDSSGDRLERVEEALAGLTELLNETRSKLGL